MSPLNTSSAREMDARAVLLERLEGLKEQDLRDNAKGIKEFSAFVRLSFIPD